MINYNLQLIINIINLLLNVLQFIDTKLARCTNVFGEMLTEYYLMVNILDSLLETHNYFIYISVAYDNTVN